ncbi:uncharacterized protein AB675_11372 [Cyphellophora attinorum]|uniref:Uncharacterized protein n=1 Tax=Cyphellophora attinorum TaxID=1664694 RepID=A0A0N0NM44_9EURO|nr:uncharacterized protein AB675_11372 [Phialophora attinorum]KPI40031.1 hypothetical protein AB675_11372 [Phialophora attinorum]
MDNNIRLKKAASAPHWDKPAPNLSSMPNDILLNIADFIVTDESRSNHLPFERKDLYFRKYLEWRVWRGFIRLRSNPDADSFEKMGCISWDWLVPEDRQVLRVSKKFYVAIMSVIRNRQDACDGYQQGSIDPLVWQPRPWQLRP